MLDIWIYHIKKLKWIHVLTLKANTYMKKWTTRSNVLACLYRISITYITLRKMAILYFVITIWNNNKLVMKSFFPRTFDCTCSYPKKRLFRKCKVNTSMKEHLSSVWMCLLPIVQNNGNRVVFIQFERHHKSWIGLQ